MLVSAPTGSGKTLAFALPVIVDVLNMQAKKALAKPRVRVVVLEPTRELAKQANITIISAFFYSFITLKLADLHRVP